MAHRYAKNRSETAVLGTHLSRMPPQEGSVPGRYCRPRLLAWTRTGPGRGPRAVLAARDASSPRCTAPGSTEGRRWTRTGPVRGPRAVVARGEPSPRCTSPDTAWTRTGPGRGPRAVLAARGDSSPCCASPGSARSAWTRSGPGRGPRAVLAARGESSCEWVDASCCTSPPPLTSLALGCE